MYTYSLTTRSADSLSIKTAGYYEDKVVVVPVVGDHPGGGGGVLSLQEVKEEGDTGASRAARTGPSSL